MSEEPSNSSPDTPAPRPPGIPVGTGFAGETTGSGAFPVGGDETVMMPAASSTTQVIGDFEVLSKLGQGGMGAVYRARQRSLDRQVALKILPATLEADADFVSRFQREARVAASLSHANLVKVYASGEADGTHYIAMELIEGETLGDWLKRGALPPLEALRILGDAARALAYGWQKAQLIHRDIKPGNIFLSIHGDVKVGDLGLAKTMGGDTTGLTQTGTAMGTPHYISPEQARGDKDLDFRADIYSLGCTFFQMLTGRTPYEGRDPMSVMYQHINSPPPAILKVLPGCPIPLARLVGKMLKKGKHERHASYAELLAQIEQVSALFAPTESVLQSALPADPDSTLLATPAATPRSGAAVPAAAGSTRRAVPDRGKTKLPLYGGIGAGVLALAAVAFMVWPKQEKLTQAERYAREQEAKRAQASPESSPGGVRQTATVDLLAAVEPKRDAVWGEWTRQTDGLAVSGSVTATDALRLQLPYEPPEEYDLEVEFTPVTGPGQLGILVSAEGRSFRVALGGGPEKTLISFDELDGKSGRDRTEAVGRLDAPLENGRRYRARVEVRRGAVRSFLEGREMVVWSGNLKRLSIGLPWKLPTPLSLGIGASSRSVVFHKAEVREITGTGKPLTRTAPPAVTENWQPARPDSGKLTQTPEGLRVEGFLTFKNGPRKDGAVRFRAPFSPDLTQVRLVARINDATKNLYQVFLNSAGNDAGFQHRQGEKFSGLHGQLRNPLATPLRPGEPCEFEFRMVGSRVTIKINGQTVAEGTETALTEGLFGMFVNFGGAVNLQAIEFLNLDTPASTSVAPPAAEAWEDVLRDPAKLAISGDAALDAEGLRISGVGRAYIRGGATSLDGAVRMRTTFGGCRPELRARMDMAAGSSYQLVAAQDQSIFLRRLHKNAAENKVLREFRLPEALQTGQEYELELRVTGQTVSAKLNGQVLGSVEDATWPSGHFGVVGYDTNRAPTLVKSLEILSLDGGAASTAPTTVTWTDALTEWWAGQNAGQILAKDGTGAKVLDRKGVFLANGAPTGDVAVRMTVRGLTDYCSIYLRQQRREGDAIRQYQAVLYRDGAVKLRLLLDKTGELAGSPSIVGFDPTKSHTLEFSAQGDQLRVLLDGTEVATARNRTLLDGLFLVTADPGAIIEKLEYSKLDAAPAAPAVAAQPLEPGAIRLWDSPEKVPTGRSGVAWKDDALYLSSTTLVVSDGKKELRPRDSLLRFALRTNPSARWAKVIVRDAGMPKTPRNYSLRLSPQDRLIEFWSGNGGPDMRKVQAWPLPRTYGDDEWMRVEFRTVGDLFTITVDGTLLGTVRDATVTDGGLMHFGATADCYFRDIVYVPLDGTRETAPPAYGANPSAAATKDAPFVNSFGMKFVPVDGGGSSVRGDSSLIKGTGAGGGTT